MISPDSMGTACPSSGRNSTYPSVQISGASSLHRKGKFIDREDEWNRLEWEIIRAGREGRILGGLSPQTK
jgi:hypothetical protein